MTAPTGTAGGLVCLQGGAEFSSGCRPMDARVVRRVAGGGAEPVRVAVVALAAAPGREHDTAAAHGVAHYRRLGAQAVAAPDARSDPAGALAAVGSADLVVLPGGSPSRLLEALSGTPVGELLVARAADGLAVSGSSAGAMVLGGWTVLPDRRGDHGPAVVPALGLVPEVAVVPHWSGGSSRGDWLRALRATAPAATVLGLPEESGVVAVHGALSAVGRTPTRRLDGGELPGVEMTPGTSWSLPARAG